MEPTPTFHCDTQAAHAKLAHLQAILRSTGPMMIAYSGGVDSAFLAAVSAGVLGDQSLAVTAASESLAPDELDEAIAVARQFHIRHEVVQTDELRDENYAANPLNP